MDLKVKEITELENIKNHLENNEQVLEKKINIIKLVLIRRGYYDKKICSL